MLFNLGGKSGSDDGGNKEKIDDLDKEKDDKSKEAGDNKGDNQGEKDDKDKGKSNEYNEDTVKKLISDAISEATKDLIKDRDSLKEQIKELSRKGLTPEQIAELDKKDKEDEQNKREAELTERENRFYALTAIKDAGLDNGDKTALELINLVMGKDQKDIDANVKTLDSLVKRMVRAEVDKTFRDNGRSPESGKGADDEEKKNDIAKKLGQRTAKLNEQARKVLDSYLGGKR